MFFRKRPNPPENFAPYALVHLRARIESASSADTLHTIPEKFFTAGVWRSKKSAFDRHDGHGKCGYCERYRDFEGECQVDHYRPRTAASDFEHTPYFDRERPKVVRRSVGYWWLAYAWSNYVLICPGCNGSKSSLFPVRSPIEMVDNASTVDENPWLLDPHDVSERERDHFRWTISGMLEPAERSSRAEWTLVICDLNRKPLVQDRVKKINEVLTALDAYFSTAAELRSNMRQNGGRAEPYFVDRWEARRADLRSLGFASAEFTGLARALINRELHARRSQPIVWDDE